MNLWAFLNILLFVFLNPFFFFLYFQFAPGLFSLVGVTALRTFDVNYVRFMLLPYLLFCPAAALLCLFVFYFTGVTLSGGEFKFAQLPLFQWSWWAFGAHLIAYIPLNWALSEKGLEGNIMGFIGAPILFTSMGILSVRHSIWLWEIAKVGG